MQLDSPQVDTKEEVDYNDDVDYINQFGRP